MVEVHVRKARANDCKEPVIGGRCSRKLPPHLSSVDRQGMAHSREEDLFLPTEVVMRKPRRHSGPPGNLAYGHVERSGRANLFDRGLNQRCASQGLHPDLGHRLSRFLVAK